MPRTTGTHESSSVAGEAVRAFIPHALPPTKPALKMTGDLAPQLQTAESRLAALDAAGRMVPSLDWFVYSFVRKEAVISSQIEGTQSSLSDLLLFELDQAPGVPIDDVVEVSDYVAAMEHGLRRLREGFPLSNRLIREIHGVLLSHGRGSQSRGDRRYQGRRHEAGCPRNRRSPSGKAAG